MTKKNQSIATWVFGLLFFGVLCLVIFTNMVQTGDQVKRQVVFLFCSLMGGIFAGFFTGQMTVNTDWGSGKKAGISAAGGFAVFVVVWFGLHGKNQTSGPTEGGSRISLSLTRVELGKPSGYWLSTNIASDNVALLADSNQNQLAQWIAQTIHGEAKDDRDEETLQVHYSPGAFETKIITNHVTHTITKVVSVPVRKMIGFQMITLPTTKTENISVSATTTNIIQELIPNRVLTITPDSEPLKSYVFFLDSGGNILRKLPEGEAKEALMPANGSIMLLLSRPGYRMELMLIDLKIPFDRTITIGKRKLVVSLDTQGFPASISDHLKELLNQQNHFKVFDNTELSEITDALKTRTTFRTQTDVDNLQSDLEQASIDYMLTMRLDQLNK